MMKFECVAKMKKRRSFLRLRINKCLNCKYLYKHGSLTLFFSFISDRLPFECVATIINWNFCIYTVYTVRWQHQRLWWWWGERFTCARKKTRLPIGWSRYTIHFSLFHGMCQYNICTNVYESENVWMCKYFSVTMPFIGIAFWDNLHATHTHRKVKKLSQQNTIYCI